MSVPFVYTLKKYIPKNFRYPTIYYGTRTHRQLGQITKELGRTAYKYTAMTILASKKHTCIHPQIMKSSDINEGCRSLLDVSFGIR